MNISGFFTNLRIQIKDAYNKTVLDKLKQNEKLYGNLQVAGNVLKKNIMLFSLAVVYIFFIFRTGFEILSPIHFKSLIDYNAYVYILGTGMLMCMLTGGNIDLSCGAFVCLLGSFGGMFMVVQGYSAGLSIVLMLLIGVAYGAILGFIIAYVHIPPWIATLVGYLAFRGLGSYIIITNASNHASFSSFPNEFLNVFSGSIFPTPEKTLNIPCLLAGIFAAAAVVWFAFNTRRKRLAKGYTADTIKQTAIKSGIGAAAILLLMTMLSLAGGIPVVMLWVVAIILIYSFITSKTTIGRHFYVVGGNKEAARLSGVNTRRIMFLAYLNMAILTSIATMAIIPRTKSVYADIGKGFELDAISACVVGGVSASGGAGKVLGMAIGATLIGVINLGMSLSKVDEPLQKVVKGFVLLGFVVFDILSQKKSK